MAERQSDPQTEYLNNFYLNLPGGARRLDAPDPNSLHAIGMKYLQDKFGLYLSQPEDTWPSESIADIRGLKVALEIHAVIDAILAEDTELKRTIDSLPKTASWSRSNDELVRPLYVKLRERFSEDDLTV